MYKRVKQGKDSGVKLIRRQWTQLPVIWSSRNFGGHCQKLGLARLMKTLS